VSLVQNSTNIHECASEVSGENSYEIDHSKFETNPPWLWYLVSGYFSNTPLKLVIHTGKLQPVLIWREKPVLLALLSNLGILVPASYPVFRTKWRKIS